MHLTKVKYVTLQFQSSNSYLTLANFASFPYRPDRDTGKPSETDIALDDERYRKDNNRRRKQPQDRIERINSYTVNETTYPISDLDRTRAVRKMRGRSALIAGTGSDIEQARSIDSFNNAIDTLRQNRDLTNQVSRIDRHMRQQSGQLKPWEQEAIQLYQQTNGRQGLAPTTDAEIQQLRSTLNLPENQTRLKNVQDSYAAINAATNKPAQTIRTPVSGLKPAFRKSLSDSNDVYPKPKTLPGYIDQTQYLSNTARRDPVGNYFVPMDALYNPSQPKGAVANASERIKNVLSPNTPVSNTNEPKLAPKELQERLVESVTPKKTPLKTSQPVQQKTVTTTTTIQPTIVKEPKLTKKELRELKEKSMIGKRRAFLKNAAIGAAGIGGVLLGGKLISDAWKNYQDNREYEQYKKDMGYI